jgi:hypothetical protein
VCPWCGDDPIVIQTSSKMSVSRICASAMLPTFPLAPMIREVATARDVLALACRVLVEAVVVVGGDGDFGCVAADGSGERDDLHDAGERARMRCAVTAITGRVRPASDPWGTPRSTSTMSPEVSIEPLGLV